MEIRIYYFIAGSELRREIKHISELMRLLNYINAMVWPMTLNIRDSTLCKPLILYLLRLYMTEDEMSGVNLALPVNLRIL